MYRGESFRKEFSNLGEVRSLIPQKARVMALTATATVKTRRAICKTLGMSNPVVVADSPNKPNIKYIVHLHPGTLEETFASVVEELRLYRRYTERVIIFCRTYDACPQIYLYMRARLGREMTDPIGAPDIATFRMVDMFTACTRSDIKDTILKSFVDPNSQLRIVIATIAFGMGLDCPNVRCIIHWGPSEDIELYLQETGRAGRDGQSAKAILYHGGPDLVARHLDDDMKEYCINKETCRREVLMSHFSATSCVSPSCSCCDICERQCVCSKCTQ